MAKASRLSFDEIHVSGDLTVDKSPESSLPWMAAIHLRVLLNGVKDDAKARRLLEKASQSCLVLNSVKTSKTFEFTVNA